MFGDGSTRTSILCSSSLSGSNRAFSHSKVSRLINRSSLRLRFRCSIRRHASSSVQASASENGVFPQLNMTCRPRTNADQARPARNLAADPALSGADSPHRCGFRGMCCPTGKIITRRSVFSSSMQARVRCLRTQLPLIPKRPSRCHARYFSSVLPP
jgi:hypothetical protein